MKVKLILPALLEATDPGFRPIKYALFPPLGLAALAGYLDPDDEVTLEDEHVMPLHLDDRPDLVVMSVYITSAKRAYRIADGYRAAAPTSPSAACTSAPDRTRRPACRQRLHRPRRGHLAGVPGRLPPRASRPPATCRSAAPSTARRRSDAT